MPVMHKDFNRHRASTCAVLSTPHVEVRPKEKENGKKTTEKKRQRKMNLFLVVLVNDLNTPNNHKTNISSS